MKIVKPLIIVLIYILAVLAAALLPTGNIDFNDIRIGLVPLDLLLHSLLFLPWMLVARIYLETAHVTGNTNSLVMWIAGGIVLGTAAEFLHFLLSYRAFNLTDMIFNITGVLAGALFFRNRR